MTYFLLVRHGNTDAVGHRLAGRLPGVDLNAEGEAQAERVAARLSEYSLSGVYSSPLERAVRTAQFIAARHQLDVQQRPGLTDIDFGQWTGKTLSELRTIPEFQRFNTQRSTTRPPGGEHPLRMQERMLSELERLLSEHPTGSIVVVSHADPIRSLLAYFLGMPLDLMTRLEVAPGSLSVLDWSVYGAVVLSVNETR